MSPSRYCSTPVLPSTTKLCKKSTLFIQIKIFLNSSSVKNATGNLTEIALNLKTALSSTAILPMLILLIQEHSISFHLFVLSSISFTSVLYFSKYKSFASLGRFIPGYFILFNVMVNGIVSLIFLFFFFVSV